MRLKSNWKKEKRSGLNQTGSEWGSEQRKASVFLTPPKNRVEEGMGLAQRCCAKCGAHEKICAALKTKRQHGNSIRQDGEYKFPPRAAPCEKSEFEYSNSLA